MEENKNNSGRRRKVEYFCTQHWARLARPQTQRILVSLFYIKINKRKWLNPFGESQQHITGQGGGGGWVSGCETFRNH